MGFEDFLIFNIINNDKNGKYETDDFFKDPFLDDEDKDEEDL